MTSPPLPPVSKPVPRRRWRELPPTAGLPLAFGDLFARDARFEQAAAEWLGVERLALTCSGTAAFVTALVALRSLSDRRVVVAPAYTCPLVAIAVARAGLELRLCDLAPDSLDMDLAALGALCDGDTLAVVPTHLGGRVADVASAAEAARKVGAFVIEDAAQGFGARTPRGPVGTLGDIGFFSLAVGKGLTLFEGGLLWAKDRTLRDACARAAAGLFGRDLMAEARRAAELLGYFALYRPSTLTLAYGAPLRRALARGDVEEAVGDVFLLYPPLHAVGSWRRRVGASALARLRAFQHERRETAARRLPALTRLPGVRVFEDRFGDEGTWPYVLLTLPDEQTRDAALGRLWASGLGVSRLFVKALPDYGYLSSVVPRADVPNARALAARSLTITNSPFMRDEEFAQVIAALQAVLRG